MRTDAECTQAYLDRNWGSLNTLTPQELAGAQRLSPRHVVLRLKAVYLGISGDPRDERPGVSGSSELIRRLWTPVSADEVCLCEEVLTVGVEMLAGQYAEPAVTLLPGPYPPVVSPHCMPFLPGAVCLTDNYTPEMTLVDLVRGFLALLRYEPGRYSLDIKRALAPGVAEWLAGGGAAIFDFPLKAADRTAPGVRLIEDASQGGGSS